MTTEADATVASLSKNLEEKLSLATTAKEANAPRILCDMGYVLPKEARPRKERLLAMAKQVFNFLWWQQQQQQQSSCQLEVVECPQKEQAFLQRRMQTLWQKATDKQQLQGGSEATTTMPFPDHVITFSNQQLRLHAGGESASADEDEHCDKDDTSQNSATAAGAASEAEPSVVYLSPDAAEALDPAQPPPRVVVVGMIIDRSVKVNRSLKRAQALHVRAAQLPLATTSSSEPLNVDCVLELMQQWHWNVDAAQQNKTGSSTTLERCCFRAMEQALNHHAQRHPGRTWHLAQDGGG